MIKKLQTKFIMLTMAALLAVLILIIGGINVANYVNIIHEVDRQLEELESMPPELQGHEEPAPPGNRPSHELIMRDYDTAMESFWNFLYASILISAIGYLLVFVLITYFSGRIIRPVLESYEKQKQFITDAGHELKTPVTIINADVDVLRMEQGDSEWLDDIQLQVKRMSELTSNLVYLSRMEESGGKLPLIEFPVSDIVEEALASFRTLAQSANKELQCDIEPMLSMKGNDKAIGQLIHILMDNAMKYSPEGSAIAISLHKQGRNLILSVLNQSNYTIAKADLPRLFDRFYRTDPSRNSETGGHGIGLSVAKAIVETHNGRIQAESSDVNTLKITTMFPI